MNGLAKVFPGMRWVAAGRGVVLAASLALVLSASAAIGENLPCTDCHNSNGILPPHESGCRDTSCLESCHAKNLSLLRHPTGPGTPLTADRTTTCNTCHNRPFADVYHPYRINVSATSPTNPGFVDLDQACGQCHGGGDNSTSNPPQPGAPYLAKIWLAGLARGIHADAPNVYFGYTFGNPNTLITNVDASGSMCTNGCDIYDWDWGDGTPHGSGVTASHTYAGAGTYLITLTVTDTGVGSGTVSQQVEVEESDLPPVVAGTCTFDANTWTETVTDASTDGQGIAQVTVSWGDGSVLSSDKTAPFGPFTHVYLNKSSNPLGYTITHKAIDTLGQQSTRTCAANPAYFTIGGTVYRSNGTTPVALATVTVKKGASVVKTISTGSNGTFSAGSLKPATYTLTVTKTGYSFASPAATITVGPSSIGNSITATAP